MTPNKIRYTRLEKKRESITFVYDNSTKRATHDKIKAMKLVSK